MTTIKTGFISHQHGRTFYRIVDPQLPLPPLLLLHGGPGSTHAYFEMLDELALRSQRPLIMYDQIGCGRSTRFDDDPTRYTAQLWLDELKALVSGLGLQHFHLLGQSWGGMLAIMYLCQERPAAVKSVILSSTLSSATLWAQELHRLVQELPSTDRQAILVAEKTKDYTTAAYQLANTHFMQRHAYPPVTAPSYPPPYKPGTSAYLAGWGPNEYTPQGTLIPYEYTNSLPTLPYATLITSGSEDLCTPLMAKTMMDALPHSRWELFENCRHMPFVEYPQRYQQLLNTWLRQHDSLSNL